MMQLEREWGCELKMIQWRTGIGYWLRMWQWGRENTVGIQCGNTGRGMFEKDETLLAICTKEL